MKATIAAATILLAASVQAQDWGRFSEPLNVELLNEKNHARLLMDFTYKGPGPEELFWLAPKDTCTAFTPHFHLHRLTNQTAPYLASVRLITKKP
ncbi:hypothetical protein [Pseudomonas chlororaphis]|uniref:hypothetical protein n=1 Tax=Pseudomonas chlororaphis TaxID=587753 RepID=UPI000F563BE4|nr:hypothetical protein [Pseudomonas chlororaphis]AZD99530.1 hypothetical protein C4K12_3666 [Pseudomonas chlororaphis subsp. aureofaciens]AZE36731.1 hypothetical protein C4K06_3700 [Pseudomonas chlororaphis subsp. aureofaciens]